MYIAILVFFSLISLENMVLATRKFQPLILAHFKYDHILKIEKALKLNIDHRLWAACPAESNEDVQLQTSSVSKHLIFVKKINKDEDFYNFKCETRIQPVVVRNKFDGKILEIGFEVYFPESMPFAIDPSQSNENIQSKHTEIMRLVTSYIRKPNTQQLAWIPVLSAKIDKKNFQKEIRYEILNAQYPDDPIRCSYPMKRDHDLINEDDFTSEFEYEDEIESKIRHPGERIRMPYMLEFLVPKNHLVTSKQVAACTLQNLISISTQSVFSWTKTNEFILEVAKKLGRLEILAGAIGVLQDPRPTGGFKSAIPRFHGHEVPVPAILYRIVKHVVKRQRYSDDLEFGIVIIHHNNPNPVEIEQPICTSICKINQWEIETDSAPLMAYCCPINDRNLELLGVKDERKFVYELDLKEIFSIKQKYEDFDNTFSPIDT